MVRKGRAVAAGISLIFVFVGIAWMVSGLTQMSQLGKQAIQGVKDSCAILKNDLKENGASIYTAEALALHLKGYDDQCASLTGSLSA